MVGRGTPPSRLCIEDWPSNSRSLHAILFSVCHCLALQFWFFWFRRNTLIHYGSFQAPAMVYKQVVIAFENFQTTTQQKKITRIPHQ
ncbi:hypothetical protein CIPAW_09G192800 [Carya illinoinensis]|uniref:Uncharacterized protein n=1 Tax=Carya illinoinensis TaxID=32201 RepID=A0A8T1PQ91_CARIL|nr:hypothetical protein CIPAW_09G192800 [Carya illinoinensis]